MLVYIVGNFDGRVFGCSFEGRLKGFYDGEAMAFSLVVVGGKDTNRSGWRLEITGSMMR